MLTSGKLLLAGDSITDWGRKFPCGEGSYAALGRTDMERFGTGYVSLLDGYLKIFLKNTGLKLTNMGISGNTSRHLLARWDTDVLAKNPDWVTIHIGVNDVWRKYDSDGAEHVPIDEYEQNVEAMITNTLPSVKGITLISPFIADTDKSDPMFKDVLRYAEVMKKLAAKYYLGYADVQERMDSLYSEYIPADFSVDRVHPSTLGAMVILKTLLDVWGF